MYFSQVRFAGTARWDPLRDPEWIDKLSQPVLYPDPEISNWHPPQCEYICCNRKEKGMFEDIDM
jgi:hypothetical protein